MRLCIFALFSLVALPSARSESVQPAVGAFDTDNPSGIPTDLPPDLQSLETLYGGSSSRGSLQGSSSDPGGPQVDSETGLVTDVGTLTSLLDPPPGYTYDPPLTQEQMAVGRELAQKRQGIATVDYRRAVGVLDGLEMNCGLGYLSEYFQTHFAAIPQPLFRRGELCGICLRIWCVDDICVNSLNQTNYAVFMITDSCEECQSNDIVVAPQGIQSISGVDYDNNPSLRVAWEFVPCGPLIFGGIRMVPSENNNPNFLGLNFSNFKVPIRSVKLNGVELKRTDYVGFWSIDSPEEPLKIRPPYLLDLLSINNERLQVNVPNLRAQNLKVNFAS